MTTIKPGTGQDSATPAHAAETEHDRRLAAQVTASADALCDQLDVADEASSDPAQRSLRRDRRYSFRKADVTATADHPSGGSAKLRAYTRNLSCSGIAFLHANFIYPGAVCMINLPRKDGELSLASGVVVQCRHIKGAWHETRLQFGKRLDPLLFVGDKAAGAPADGDTIELGALAGRVLYVDDSRLDHRLMAHYLKGSQITLQCAATPEETEAAVRGNAYDILMCDLNLAGQDGLNTVRQARAAGFCGPIVVVTAENRGDRLAQCKAAGVQHVLPKPYAVRALLQLLSRLHEEVGAVVGTDVMYSSIDEEPDTRELLAAYVQDAKLMTDRLQAAVVAGDVTAAREICLSFKGTAAGYGFIPLQVAAEAAVTALDATMSVEESRAPLRKLELMCGRLTLRAAPVEARGAPEKMI